MKQVKLKHFSFIPGAVGQPGHVVSVSDEQAAAWEANGGAEIIGEAPAPKKKTRTAAKDKPEVER